MTQVELAKKLGYTSTGTISQIETGKRGMEFSKIEKVAEIFGIHPSFLMSTKPFTDEALEMILKFGKVLERPDSMDYEFIKRVLD